MRFTARGLSMLWLAIHILAGSLSICSVTEGLPSDRRNLLQAQKLASARSPAANIPEANVARQIAPAPSRSNTDDLFAPSEQIAPVPFLEQYNSSDVAIIGSVLGAKYTQYSSVGGSIVTLQLQQLPWNTTTSRATCAYVSCNLAAELTQASQDVGVGVPVASEQVQPEYLQLVADSPESRAALVLNETPDCKTTDKSCPKGLYNFTLSCSVPKGGSRITPLVVLHIDPDAANDDDDDGQAPLWYVVGGGSGVCLQPVSFQTASPLIGPMSGNTSVVIKGTGLEPGMQCVFADKAAEPERQMAAIATNISSSQMLCSTPQWSSANVTALSVDMSLRWSDGFELPAASFLYVKDPIISTLQSDVLHYGGGNISAGFNFSYADIADPAQAQGLQPVLRLQQPNAKGDHVDLPAKLSADMSSLAATVPTAQNQRPALENGSWLVQASLNGGHDFSAAREDPNLALHVSGPTVAMRSAYYQLRTHQQAVQLYAELQGGRPGLPPISVAVTMEQRFADGVAAVERPANLLTEQLRWDASSNASQLIELQVPKGSQGNDSAMVVRLQDAVNADVSAVAQTTIVSQAPPNDFIATFSNAINKAVYPGDPTNVDIRVKPGRIPTPAVVQYTARQLTLAKPPFLMGISGIVTGELQWDSGNLTHVQLALPLDWSEVPMDAVYRVGLSLQPAWNAEVANMSQQPALHIFGVAADTCPPGTFSKAKPATAPLLSPNNTQVTVDNSSLRRLSLMGPDGAPFELSSQFQPNTTLYGAMVPTDVRSALLCVEPPAGGAIAVFNALHQALSPLNNSVIATFSSRLPGTRRLQQLPVVNRCGSNQAAYQLPLTIGQNMYQTVITMPKSPTQQAPNITAYSAAAGAQGATNNTVTYSLAVVRTAVPAHARLATLNATVNNGGDIQVLAVCGTPLAAQAAAVNEAHSPAANEPMAEAGDSGSMAEDAAVVPCSPDAVMKLSVSSETTYLSLHPGLLYPSIQGIRVEVNGQVLSQGGNLGADRIMDTTSRMQNRSNPAFLPPAVIIGPHSDSPLQVPVVIVAEDGVTSLKYYVEVTFRPPPPLSMASRRTAEYAKEAPAARSELGIPGSSNGNATGQDASLPSSPLAEALAQSVGPSAGAALLLSASGPQPDEDADSDSDTAQAVEDALQMSAAAKALLQPPPPGWPAAPAQSPQCGPCVAGWASTTANASYCTMCQPGTFAASAFAPECVACPKGTYGSSWGSTHCRHCVTGTYGPREGGQLCLMCPANFTTEADGGIACTTPVGNGTDLSSRYAVLVSFGVLLNGTALDDIAWRAGVNASSSTILETLVRSDTASAFNVSLSDVHVTRVTQVSSEVLHLKVSAALPVDIPDDASPDDVRAAVNVKSISADEPIKLLVKDPDKFFGRTTQALDVVAANDGKGARRTLSTPSHRRRLALEWPAILGIILGGLVMAVLTATVFARRRTRRLYQGVRAQLQSWRLNALHRGWPNGALVQRQHSGISTASSATLDHMPPSTSGAHRVRARPADRILPRAHADSAAEVA